MDTFFPATTVLLSGAFGGYVGPRGRASPRSSVPKHAAIGHPARARCAPAPGHDVAYCACTAAKRRCRTRPARRSEEHTSELQSLMRNSYAVFCLQTKTNTNIIN